MSSVLDPYLSQYGNGSKIFCLYLDLVLDSDRIQGFHYPKERTKFLNIMFIFFSSQTAKKTLIKDSQAQVNPSGFHLKLNALFNWKSLNFSLFGCNFYCPGSRSGSVSSIRSRIQLVLVPFVSFENHSRIRLEFFGIPSDSVLSARHSKDTLDF